MVSFADQVPENENSMYAGRLKRVHYIESYKKFNRMTRDEIEKMLTEQSEMSDEENESCVDKINKVLNSCEGCHIF